MFIGFEEILEAFAEIDDILQQHFPLTKVSQKRRIRELAVENRPSSREPGTN